MSTVHNTAAKGDIADFCLMVGDPLRAKMIAENYLVNAKCFNTVRGMLGYTGTYKGKKVSVMGHGMGIPSIGIYSYELYAFYGVETIVRIGSAGAFNNNMQLGEIILGQAACHDSNYAQQYKIPGTYAPIADFELLLKAAFFAKERKLQIKVGNVLSSDVFYQIDEDYSKAWLKMGILCSDMECAGLYMNAAYLGKKALGILTISDIIGDDTRKMTADERRTSLGQAIELGLALND